MLDVTTTVKNLYNENAKQYIRIDFPNNNATIRLTESDIVQGTFRWDRYCTTGDMLEIGTAIASEVEFDLINNGSFKTTGGAVVPVSDISFEGKELTIDIGVMNGSSISWLPIGKFTIMSMPHKFSTIHISALDRMTLFDMFAPAADGSNPFAAQETLGGMVSDMCSALHISFVYPSSAPNRQMTVDIGKLFEDEPQVTFRQLIQWIAALMGTCAYIDYEGDLIFSWLTRAKIGNANIRIAPHERYSSSVYEPVMFGGLSAEKDDVSISFGSNSYYRYTIADNALLQGENWINTYRSNLSSIWDTLQPTSTPYRPFEASVVPMPYLEPLDIVEYQDNDGTVFDTIITRITFTLNGGTSISAAGISETEAQCVGSGYTTRNRDSAKMDALKERITLLENETIAARQQLTDLVRMATGLQKIELTDGSGNTIYYFTTASFQDDEPTLANLGQYLKDNDVIYTFSSAGWVWCFGSDWDANAQAPAVGWRFGITKDGSAILGQVNTSGIHVSDENTAYRTVITPESFSVYNGAIFVFGFNGQLESQINRLLVKSNIQDPSLENNAYIRIGSAMLLPAADGLDIAYVEDI